LIFSFLLLSVDAHQWFNLINFKGTEDCDLSTSYETVSYKLGLFPGYNYEWTTADCPPSSTPQCEIYLANWSRLAWCSSYPIPRLSTHPEGQELFYLGPGQSTGFGRVDTIEECALGEITHRYNRATALFSNIYCSTSTLGKSVTFPNPGFGPARPIPSPQPPVATISDESPPQNISLSNTESTTDFDKSVSLCKTVPTTAAKRGLRRPGGLILAIGIVIFMHNPAAAASLVIGGAAVVATVTAINFFSGTVFAADVVPTNRPDGAKKIQLTAEVAATPSTSECGGGGGGGSKRSNEETFSAKLEFQFRNGRYRLCFSLPLVLLCFSLSSIFIGLSSNGSITTTIEIKVNHTQLNMTHQEFAMTNVSLEIDSLNMTYQEDWSPFGEMITRPPQEVPIEPPTEEVPPVSATLPTQAPVRPTIPVEPRSPIAMTSDASFPRLDIYCLLLLLLLLALLFK